MSSAERPQAAGIGRILLAAALLAGALAGAQPLWAAAKPSEQQCRAAVTAMVDALRTQPMARERDERRRKELLAEMEQLVETHRSQGIDACGTWKEINYRAVRQ